MRYKILLFANFIFFSFLSLSQDLITLKNGEDIKAKILKIGLNEVEYKRFDNLDGPLIVVAKSDILIIRYENGEKEIFQKENLRGSENKTLNFDNRDWTLQAQQDAQKYYRGYRKHFAGTFIPCIFLGPIIGLGPAGGNMRAKIKEEDMINDRNPEWFKNEQYLYSYTNYAKKMKAKRVWGGYIGGSGIFIGVVGLLFTSGTIRL